MSLRVAGIQMPVTRDIAANQRYIEDAILWASAENADILLTPEGSLSGYTHELDVAKTREALERVTAAAAARAQVGLALGTCFLEASDGKTYNQLRFYTPDWTLSGFPQQNAADRLPERRTRGRDQPLCHSPLAIVPVCRPADRRPDMQRSVGQPHLHAHA